MRQADARHPAVGSESMNWIRRVSLVRRVTFGFAGMAVAMGGLGGVSMWRLQSQATEVDRWAGAAATAPASTAVLQAFQAGAGAAFWAMGGLTTAGVLLAVVTGWLIRRSIKDSVESTIHCVIGIAGGGLETKIESPGRDEISWLRGELNSMRKKLRTMVIEVRKTIGDVTVASQDIASGNADLSARTESQASALQQTASSMQQLAETVRSNAQSTHEARSVVTQSTEVAARGAQMMRDVIGRMGEINASANKISDIIGVIDGIAFQTNILALNAAVEAARAGEHGRGFAVVASEVRALAQRSSTAAREIKMLIGDSAEKVDAGSKLVDNAGRTMEEILSSVNRVSTLIAEIASAGESQSSDLSQVHHSISQIDTMTQQNAALVEQLAASAQSLQGQSGRLEESMGSFRLAA
jgi:methyl-accepting chemotaxis protein